MIIVDHEYEECVRRCLNFGFKLNGNIVEWSKYGTNGKMADIAASFILHHWDSIDVDRMYKLYEYFCEELVRKTKLQPFPNHGIAFPSCIPVIFDRKIGNDEIVMFMLHSITTRKYYKPLVDTLVATDIYDRILCLPMHNDITYDIIDRYINVIMTISK